MVLIFRSLAAAALRGVPLIRIGPDRWLWILLLSSSLWLPGPLLDDDDDVDDSNRDVEVAVAVN